MWLLVFNALFSSERCERASVTSLTRTPGPQNSPDLNLLDYRVWGGCWRSTNVWIPNRRTSQTKALLKIWDELPQYVVKKSITGFRRHLRTCITTGMSSEWNSAEVQQKLWILRIFRVWVFKHSGLAFLAHPVYNATLYKHDVLKRYLICFFASDLLGSVPCSRVLNITMALIHIRFVLWGFLIRHGIIPEPHCYCRSTNAVICWYCVLNLPVLCPDINECIEIPDACSQFCVNSVGSYICKCAEGYIKTSDNRTCKKRDGRFCSVCSMYLGIVCCITSFSGFIY